MHIRKWDRAAISHSQTESRTKSAAKSVPERRCNVSLGKCSVRREISDFGCRCRFGYAQLAGAIVLGPCIGKFTREGEPRVILGSSPVLAALGALILFFGCCGGDPDTRRYRVYAASA